MKTKKQMKCLAAIGLLLATCVGTVAQSEKGTFKPTHEVNIGLGFAPLVPSYQDLPYNAYCHSSNGDGYYLYDNYNNYYSYEAYYMNMYDKCYFNGAPAVNISYLYNMKKWLALGATFSFHLASQDIYNKLTDEWEESNIYGSYSLIFKAKFIYLNREWVRLYGEAGIGVGMSNTHSIGYGYGDNSMRIHFAGNLSPFGVEVGKKLYGYVMPTNISSNGVFIFGLGYKF